MLAGLAGVYATLRPRVVAEVRRARLMARLKSSDPQERMQAAWSVAEFPDPDVLATLAQHVMGDEGDDEVREAFIYSLGRSGDRAFLPAVRYATEAHETGPGRTAAWLAMARIDPDEFRAKAPQGGSVGDTWDLIAIAQGRLALGELTSVGVLLRYAVDGDEGQRFVCTQSLWKGLRPLLEAAGRWPIEPILHEGETWPVDFAREVEKRAAELDLPAIQTDTRRHLAATTSLRQTVRRLNTARVRATRWLYSDAEDTIHPTGKPAEE